MKSRINQNKALYHGANNGENLILLDIIRLKNTQKTRLDAIEEFYLFPFRVLEGSFSVINGYLGLKPDLAFEF